MEHDGGMMDGGMMSGMMGAWMVLWALIGLALLALVVVATVWLAKRISPDPSDRSAGADEVLRRRYAAGEIAHEDFVRMREELGRR